MTMLEVIGLVLSLNEEVFQRLNISTMSLRFALSIVVVAALSEALGQSVILFANRVKPQRFMMSIVLSALITLLGFLFYTISIHLVAEYIFFVAVNYQLLVKAIALAYAPYLFSFFVLTPYLGSGIAVTLSLWVLLAMLVAIRALLGLSLIQALMTASLGWILLQIVQRTLGRPLKPAMHWIRRKTAGTQLIKPS